MATRLNITSSAYRELETTPQSPLRNIGEAIISLADDPHPPGSSRLQNIGGCSYLAIDDYYILYHLDQDDGSLRKDGAGVEASPAIKGLCRSYLLPVECAR